MARFILLRGAKQLLTLRGPSGVRRGAALHDLGIIEDGSLLIRDGVVAAVGSTRRIENLKEARTALEIPVNGRIIMPGFVDPSINLNPREGVISSRQSAKGKKLAEFQDESLALMRSCLQHGTLTAEVRTAAASGDSRSHTALFRRLAKIGNNPVAMVRTWKIDKFPDTDGPSFNEFRDTLSKLADRNLAQFVEVILGPDQPVDESLFRAIREQNLGLKLVWRGGSLESLANLLSRFRPQTVSCPTCFSSAECSLLSTAGSITIFAPAREAFEGPSATCARQMADSGGGIALCTDYDFRHPASSSMQMAVSLAVMLLKLTAEEAIIASTINAAHAVGRGQKTGSLEAEKNADALVLNLPDYREIPRQFGINHVDMVIRNGEVVLNRTRWKVSAAASNL